VIRVTADAARMADPIPGRIGVSISLLTLSPGDL